MNGRDPMDDFMSRVEREFFGGNSGLFGTFQGSGGGFPHQIQGSSHNFRFDDEFPDHYQAPMRRGNRNQYHNQY